MSAGLESVLELATRGWRLLPCTERAKTPLIRDWPRRASSDAFVIQRWAHQHEGCNWGLATGKESGVFVVDVDGSDEVLRERGIVDTLASKTSRGKHLYFTHPGTVIRNSAGKIGAGLDVRGDGGYVLIPPSVHPSGAFYEWIEPQQSVANAPDWLLEIVTDAKRPIAKGEIGILPQGCRNDGLTRLAGAMRRRGATATEIETVLSEHNARRCRPALSEQEVKQIAISVSRYAPGGLDPLQAAWQAVHQDTCRSQYDRFVALARQLQRSRPEQPVALPLERIAELMECAWTTVRYHRKRAVLEGLLHREGDYIPHRRATQYRVSLPLGVPTSVPTNGLVAMPLVAIAPSGNSSNLPSGNGRKSPSGNGHGFPSEAQA